MTQPFNDLRMVSDEAVSEYRDRLRLALDEQVARIAFAPPHDYSAVPDLTKESYCHRCGGWEPIHSYNIRCTDCGHVYQDARNVKTWADFMERAGYDALPPTLCPFCAGELQ